MSLPARANQTLSNHCSSTRATSTISFRIPSPSSLSFCGARLRGSTSPARRYRRGHHRWEPTRRVDAAWLRPYFFGGPIRCQVRFGFWVGGKGVSPGSMVTLLGLGTEPPRGPRSMYSPGRDGFSPGFWSRDITSLPIKKFRCRNQASTQNRGRRIRSLGLEHQAGPGRRLPRFGTKPSRLRCITYSPMFPRQDHSVSVHASQRLDLRL